MYWHQNACGTQVLNVKLCQDLGKKRFILYGLRDELFDCYMQGQATTVCQYRDGGTVHLVDWGSFDIVTLIY